jgi:hypothetical protein
MTNDKITLTREEAQQVLDAFVNWDARGRLRLIETLRTRLSQCERCGEVNPAEIHTCTPQETVLLSYWQEEARRYCENAEYWRSRCNAQSEPDIVQDAVVYGTGIAKDGKRIDPASIYKEPEPVAYGVLDDDGQIDWTAEYPFSNEPGWPDSVPLYTAPPQREWQGLTDEEIKAVYGKDLEYQDGDYARFARAIEAKLKEKNT